MRTLTPGRAFFAGVLGFGYLYVGRVWIELAVIGAALSIVAVMSWTRLILTPYGISASLLGVSLFGALRIVHPILIARQSPSTRRKPYNVWWCYVLYLLLGVSVWSALVGNRAIIFGYEAFSIPSQSMAPTLVSRDYIIVDAWRYKNASPQAGDIVVYFSGVGSGARYAKRIVAVPGDVIELKGGLVTRNGSQVREDYANPGSGHSSIGSFGPLELEGGQYFVLGDNRDNSRDSRFHGPIHESQIAGRVEAIWFSLAGMSRFPKPLYQAPDDS